MDTEAQKYREMVHKLFDGEVEASEVVERARDVVTAGAWNERNELPYRADIDG